MYMKTLPSIPENNVESIRFKKESATAQALLVVYLYRRLRRHICSNESIESLHCARHANRIS